MNLSWLSSIFRGPALQKENAKLKNRLDVMTGEMTLLRKWNAQLHDQWAEAADAERRAKLKMRNQRKQLHQYHRLRVELLMGYRLGVEQANEQPKDPYFGHGQENS